MSLNRKEELAVIIVKASCPKRYIHRFYIKKKKVLCSGKFESIGSTK